MEKGISPLPSVTSFLSSPLSHFSYQPRLHKSVSLTDSPTGEKMKRHPFVESMSKSLLLEENNFSSKEAEKAKHPKGSRWEAEESLRALPSHLSGNKLCFSVPNVSELHLCGCSLRTKAVLHPRPPPVRHPASQVLPNFSAGRKQQSPPGIIFRAQLSQSSPEPKAKAKAKAQGPPWGGSRISCNATPPRKLIPMGVWPQGFLDPLTKSLLGESLHTIPHWKGAISPSRKPYP
ncbi:uncharacterized protein LOC115297000 [Suricata suricatta]|uniref:Uncharacterized protein n=1 Tax=Suricata suricatta TaxID=37032 RepID=A0A673T3N5_SURSU|nr:uncharacterized protein LOC115297000 [Suricata suricatta]